MSGNIWNLAEIIMEVGSILFVVAILAMYRERVFDALKEIFFDIIFAAFFIGVVILALGISNKTLVGILFVVGLFTMVAVRYIYHHFIKNGGGAPPMPKQMTGF